MAPRLKPLSKDEDLAAIPVDQPVLVQLEPPATAMIADNELASGQDETAQTQQHIEADSEDPGVKVIKEQMVAQKAASDAENARLAEVARTERERANNAERQVREARTEVVDAETSAVETGLAGAQREAAAAKLAYKAAMEQGDFDASAEAQERIARAATDIREFERSAAMLADRKEQQSKEPQHRQSGPVDPVMAIDAQPGLMPVEKTWLKEHQDAWIDPERNKELGVAYSHAMRKGFVRGSETYFKFINEFMGYEKPASRHENDDDNGGETIVAAPVSRDNRSSSTGQQTGSRITLTPEQREFARSMGLSDVEYARGVVQLNADKKANPEKFNMMRN